MAYQAMNLMGAPVCGYVKGDYSPAASEQACTW